VYLWLVSLVPVEVEVVVVRPESDLQMMAKRTCNEASGGEANI